MKLKNFEIALKNGIQIVVDAEYARTDLGELSLFIDDERVACVAAGEWVSWRSSLIAVDCDAECIGQISDKYRT